MEDIIGDRIATKELKKRFLVEEGVDLETHLDYDTFKYYKRNGKWDTISSHLGWKMYSEWLETIIINKK